jgi:hypothetical protein
VRLRPATGAGLTALVWLPDEVVAREASTKPGGLGRFPEPLGRFAIGAGPAGITGGALAGPGGAAPAAIGGMPGSGEWPPAISSTTEQEVAAARTPRFAPQEDDAGTRLGPQRVPGAGPHPGRFGPSNGPGLAGDPESAEVQPQVAGDMFGTEPTPMFGGGHPSVPSQAFDNEWSAPFAAGSGRRDVRERDRFDGEFAVTIRECGHYFPPSGCTSGTIRSGTSSPIRTGGGAAGVSGAPGLAGGSFNGPLMPHPVTMPTAAATSNAVTERRNIQNSMRQPFEFELHCSLARGIR